MQQRILSAIDEAGGWIDFSAYMQQVLYEPGLGYYSAGASKLGPGGDFTTGPELSDWLAEALAAFLVEQFSRIGAARILELGAGTGSLAERLLVGLADRGVGPVEYSIMETSADLRERQIARLGGSEQIVWLDELPAAPFDGVILANEVADALPVVRFVRNADGVLPLGVIRDGEQLAMATGPADAALSETVAAIEAARGEPLPEGYRSEYCPLLRPWLTSLCESVSQGGVLLIDYGLNSRDYYSATRADGTLICHYRQRAHTEPLLWPGLQDLTAWVNFTEVASIARATGTVLSGYTTQTQFLLASIAADSKLANRVPTASEASALKTLILPGEMGEHFKLIWLTRNLPDSTLPGRDFRNWL